jgi:hypothetical protein
MAKVRIGNREGRKKTALGRVAGHSYSARVSAFLRWVGIVNAAIWFGASIFLLVALGAIFSADILELFKKSGDVSMFYSGAVANAVFHRFFVLQYVCGIFALLHLLAERLYLGRTMSRLGTGLVGVLLLAALVGGAWVQPHMEDLRRTMYSSGTAEVKARAEHSFKAWHVTSQCANLAVMAGLLAHLLRVTRSEESRRYGTIFPQFRG